MRAIRVWSVAVLAVVALGGAASLASAASPTGGVCSVTVDRSMAPDTFHVTRQKLDNGDCVCYISTGPTSQSAGVEQSIANVEASRECGRKTYPVGALVGAGALAGAIAAATGGHHHNNNSPGG